MALCGYPTLTAYQTAEPFSSVHDELLQLWLKASVLLPAYGQYIHCLHDAGIRRHEIYVD